MDGSAIEFNVPRTSTTYIDLKNTLLSVKLKIVKADGTDIEEASKVGLTNGPLHSIFSQVDFNVQQHPTTETGTNYTYKAYIDTLLNTSDRQELDCQLFMFDEPRNPNMTDPAGSNHGLYDQAVYTAGGKVVDLIGKLPVDICQKVRLLLNCVPLNIKLWQHNNPFRLATVTDTEAFQVKLIDAALHIATVQVNPSVLIGQAETIKTSDALYPYTRSVIKTYAVPKGQYAFITDDLFQGEVPKRLIVGIVSSSAIHGTYTKNLFNFQHCDCNFARFFVDGQSVPSQPLQPNYANNNYVEAYQRLTDANAQRRAIHLMRLAFKQGTCLYVFNPDVDTKDRLSERAHTCLELKFAKILPETRTVIVYAQFPALMRIDASRSVSLE